AGQSSDNQDVRIPADPVDPDRASAWTLPLLCAGIAILACCLLIPAADDNRRLVWERERLKSDLVHIKKQISINDQFLRSVASDPTLLERLAQRQMKMVQEGSSVLELRGDEEPSDMSPFLLLNLPPPDPMAAYQPMGGVFSDLCRRPRSRLMLLGTGLLMLASGLVVGATSSRA
ncbi:MAG: hypothetical protein ACREJC_22895, partial [Tepidisphaeraceae bacterium]